MATTTLVAGDLTNPASFSAGNDGSVIIQSGLAGAKVNALSFAADGTPTFLKGPVNVVAFSAYQSTVQSIPSGTFTALQFQTKEFDTAGCFNNTASPVVLNGLTVPAYSFMPNVAGYYEIKGAFSGAATGPLCTIYKNGVRFKDGTSTQSTGAFCVQATGQVYLNGTTDYVGLNGYHITGSAINTSSGAAFTYFQGILIAKA